MSGKNISHINYTIKEINDATDEIYESFFENSDELKKSLTNLINILNSIINDIDDE